MTRVRILFRRYFMLGQKQFYFSDRIWSDRMGCRQLFIFIHWPHSCEHLKPKYLTTYFLPFRKKIRSRWKDLLCIILPCTCLCFCSKKISLSLQVSELSTGCCDSEKFWWDTKSKISLRSSSYIIAVIFGAMHFVACQLRQNVRFKQFIR